jgi:hypothetical protein
MVGALGVGQHEQLVLESTAKQRALQREVRERTDWVRVAVQPVDQVEIVWLLRAQELSAGQEAEEACLAV